ncbi:MAG: Clp protease ClpS [Nitrospinae bacterium CG11_big_fil_rev_8_21_14_0_20_56_8]|nr:MAG: Clp protease ClpS [Nitrospinae bacterium CG11_big_fil_rev_8_21_14_0_20_56_8]
MPTETLPYQPGIVEDADSSTDKFYMPLYKVIMWNDEVTTMEFVIRVLIKLFGKDYPTAEKFMYEIHYTGAAHVDTLPLEQAEFKVEQVHSAAALENFPFTCTIEPT